MTSCWGLEVQNLTQTLKSVESPGNTFDLNPKWSTTLSAVGIFKWMEFCTSSPQQGVKYQLWYLNWRGDLYISHEQLQMDGKILAHLRHTSKVLPETLNDLSTWVGICTSSSQQHVKYRLWYLDFCLGGGGMGVYEYPMENSKRQSSCLLGV